MLTATRPVSGAPPVVTLQVARSGAMMTPSARVVPQAPAYRPCAPGGALRLRTAPAAMNAVTWNRKGGADAEFHDGGGRGSRAHARAQDERAEGQDASYRGQRAPQSLTCRQNT